MAGIVNLRTARKRLQRMKKRAEGTANAAKFGRSRADREAKEQRARAQRVALDGHLRERGGEAGEPPQ
ncbi:DUF4169 family protein [Albidovulum sp.]